MHQAFFREYFKVSGKIQNLSFKIKGMLKSKNKLSPQIKSNSLVLTFFSVFFNSLDNEIILDS